MTLAPFNKLNQKGFTLLEVLISIVIVAYLMLNIYTIVDDGTNTKVMVSREDRYHMQLLRGLNRMEVDISQVYSPLYFSNYEQANTSTSQGAQGSFASAASSSSSNSNGITFQPTEKFAALSTEGHLIPIIESRTKNEFIIYTRANRRNRQDQKQSQFAWIRYEIKTMEGEALKDANLSIVRTVNNIDLYSPRHNWNQFKSQVLLENLKDVRFWFWSRQRDRFVETIQESREDRIITGFKVEGILVGEDNYEIPFSQTFTPLLQKQDDLNAANTQNATNSSNQGGQNANSGSN